MVYGKTGSMSTEILKENYLYKMVENVDSPEYSYEILLIEKIDKTRITGITVYPIMYEPKWDTSLDEITQVWNIQEIGPAKDYPEYTL